MWKMENGKWKVEYGISGSVSLQYYLLSPNPLETESTAVFSSCLASSRLYRSDNHSFRTSRSRLKIMKRAQINISFHNTATLRTVKKMSVNWEIFKKISKKI